MQYHQIIIFFHRPWVSKSYIQPRSPRQGPGYHHARRMCIESATAVARLLHIYEKHFTFRRMTNQAVAIIFSAALMLLFVTVSSSPLMPSKPGESSQPHPRNAEMVAYLNLCFRALDELGQSFENAKRTRDYLVTLQRRWQTHMRRSGPRAKRQISAANSPHRKPSSVGGASAGIRSGQTSGPDASRKKSRLATSDVHSQPTMQAQSSVAAPFSADPSYPSTQNQHQDPYSQQSFATQQPGNFDWIRTSDLNILAGTQGNVSDHPNVLGDMSTPQFLDESNLLPDLGDMEGWWSSPNGNSGLGGPNL